jgi:hypothetical protein
MTKRKRIFPPILFMYMGAIAGMGAMVYYRIATEAPGVLSSIVQ